MKSNMNHISLILPCYNEEGILSVNLNVFYSYLNSCKYRDSFELLVINDGSKDKTGIIAEKFSETHPNVRVIHHPINLNLGNALKTGFNHAKGDIIIVLDIDLSYAVDNIEKMADKLIEEHADIVVASPYMKGGEVIAVPLLRKVMSRVVNRFMQFASQEKYYTFTGMARAYRASFIRSVNLKTKDYEINPEIMYKSMILRARIVEIPAKLDWTEQNKHASKRKSSLQVIKGFFSGLMAGFIFRPYIFFWTFGTLLLLLSLYQLVWLFFDTIRDMSIVQVSENSSDTFFSKSLALNFQKNPQSFIVGGITFIVAVQFFSLGFLSLQSKRYFEELFHLGTHLKQRDGNKKADFSGWEEEKVTSGSVEK
jgi:glycosyltransferase involved in cell wall biosynthesis